MTQILNTFLTAIHKLPSKQSLTKKDLITDTFLLSTEKNIQMYYAPHNEYVNQYAQIVIVGITPGWHQMKTAYEQFVKSLSMKRHIEQALYDAKIAARFAGTMRNNLITMLEACGIPNALNIPSTKYLFNPDTDLLHTTSIIKYPVFIRGVNYTGHQPSIQKSTLLKDYVYHKFPIELDNIKQPALIIPLGKIVDEYVTVLKQTNSLPTRHTYLSGFPHPSGANGHRLKQFALEKEQLIRTTQTWGEQSFNGRS